MTIQPKNLSLLTGNNFLLQIDRLPLTTYFLQAFNLSGVTSGTIDVANNTSYLGRLSGDTVRFDDLTATVLADEDLKTYQEIVDWIVYNATHNGSERQESNATLHILTNNRTSNLQINYTRLFPISITGINFDSRIGPEATSSFNVVFRFVDFTIVPKADANLLNA